MIFKILNKNCGNLGQILEVVMSEIFYVNLKCAFQCKLAICIVLWRWHCYSSYFKKSFSIGYYWNIGFKYWSIKSCKLLVINIAFQHQNLLDDKIPISLITKWTIFRIRKTKEVTDSQLNIYILARMSNIWYEKKHILSRWI